MDAIIISNLINKSIQKNKKIEHMHEEEYREEHIISINHISMFSFVMMIIINSYAAYLSWECNTEKNYPLNLKILFSFLSFMFGSLYIMYYILFRFDSCNKF